MQPPLNIDLDTLAALVKEAGKLALTFYGKVSAQEKPDRSLVSEADRAVEIFLSEQLAQQFPNTAILGEEYGSNEIVSDHLWVLDPIDGTAAFLNKFPAWGVSVGYMHQGKPMAGTFYLPVTDDIFLGNQTVASWNQVPIPQSQTYQIDSNTWLFIPSNCHRRYDIDFPGKARSFGSAAAHVGYVAAGKAIGALLGRTSLWDIAGVLPILRTAGGDLYTIDGERLDIQTLLQTPKAEKPVIACPKWYAPELIERISLRA